MPAADAYHHGDLRAELLAAAEEVLRTQGREAIALRDLARTVGVSHAAPQRHFADRQALLDALTERGLLRLSAMIDRAMAKAGPSFLEQFTAPTYASPAHTRNCFS